MTVNPPAPCVSYFTPKQTVKAGKAIDPQPNGNKIPKIFQPLKIKGLTLQNRIGVAPMCMYSAVDGVATSFHLAHYGSLATRGPGLIMTEALAVVDYGRISPNDLGIYNDEQAYKLKETVDFVHSQGQYIGPQLALSGRKGSTVPPWVAIDVNSKTEDGGFGDRIVAPSPIAFKEFNPIPHELTEEEIKEIVKAFGEAARRAVYISGFDFVEVHGAHGYLVSNFLSSFTNKRTDKYGGSFENRIRFLLEVIEEIKKNIKETTPLFLRFSASENADEEPLSWTIEDSIRLSKIVVEKGIDLLDISSGGNIPTQTRRGNEQGFQVPLSKAIKAAIGDRALVSAVGGIKEAKYASDLVEQGVVDLVLVGRPFLKNPGLVWSWADDLDIRLYQIGQYEWGWFGSRDRQPELYSSDDIDKEL